MITREPKCVEWKRRGAEHVASKLSGFSPEQELKFWKDETKKLKLLQAKVRKHRKQISYA
ncbi:hypothetical protein QUF75_07475 [Desulfococcaceae bacterium HSG7]|nr:hypothetical protein [Desulfococcaceae bacterium HSG7]